jgi:hypothetical protein
MVRQPDDSFVTSTPYPAGLGEDAGIDEWSFVLATLQADLGDVVLKAAVPHAARGSFTLHLSGPAVTDAPVAWRILNDCWPAFAAHREFPLFGRPARIPGGRRCPGGPCGLGDLR